MPGSRVRRRARHADRRHQRGAGDRRRSRASSRPSGARSRSTPSRYVTSRPGVFAGGDVVTGPEHGDRGHRRRARTRRVMIDRYVTGKLLKVAAEGEAADASTSSRRSSGEEDGEPPARVAPRAPARRPARAKNFARWSCASSERRRAVRGAPVPALRPRIHPAGLTDRSDRGIAMIDH